MNRTGLFIALGLALFSAAVAQAGRTLLAAVTAFFALALAGWVGVTIVPALAKESIRVLSLKELRPPAREFIENFYAKSAEPLLTPVTVDPAHPFPHVLNKALCLAFLLKRKRRTDVLGDGITARLWKIGIRALSGKAGRGNVIVVQ